MPDFSDDEVEALKSAHRKAARLTIEDEALAPAFAALDEALEAVTRVRNRGVVQRAREVVEAIKERGRNDTGD